MFMMMSKVLKLVDSPKPKNKAFEVSPVSI